MSDAIGNGNGNGNAEHSQQSIFAFAAGLKLENSENPQVLRGLEREIANLGRPIAILTVAMARLVKLVEGQRKQLMEIAELVKKGLTPLAEENNRLQSHQIDDTFVRTVVLGIIDVIDRQSTEITSAEKEAFSQIEELRRIDKEELLQLLRRLDIVSFHPRAAKFDATAHAVVNRPLTPDHKKVGTIAKILRPGYRRNSDGFVFRKVWVDVWIEKTSE